MLKVCSPEIPISTSTSHSRVFCKKYPLKKFHKMRRKTPVPESTFNKVTGPRPKKRLWHRCFPVNFAKVLRTVITPHITPLMAASVLWW